MSIGKVAKCHIAMGAWIVIRKKARACPGRGFIPWASGGQPRHHITSLLLNVPGLFNHHLPHLLEIGVRKGSLCICHPGSRLICRSHRDEACAAGWQGVDRMWTCGNNKASTFLWRLCFVWCGTRRTVCFCGARFFGRLEFTGKFGVPQLVTINKKSASYGVQWNRIRIQ